MPLPEPHSGLVIGYEFLWKHEDDKGATEGKKRPCAIVAVVESTEEGENPIVIVLPITHTEPTNPDIALLIPDDVKNIIGLDEEDSWVICSELNKFMWPGFDLRPVSNKDPAKFDYGTIPSGFFKAIKAKIKYLREGNSLKVVSRSE